MTLDIVDIAQYAPRLQNGRTIATLAGCKVSNVFTTLTLAIVTCCCNNVEPEEFGNHVAGAFLTLLEIASLLAASAQFKKCLGNDHLDQGGG